MPENRVTAQQKKAVAERVQQCCEYCQSQAGFAIQPFSVEHIIPRSQERASKLGDSDKTKFIVSLEEPVRLDLISPKDAQDLIRAVENGQIPLKNAIKMVEDVIKSAKP